MAEIYSGDKIPNLVLHDLLFDTSGRQQVVPFLGAGVSLAALPTSKDAAPEITFPDLAKVEKAAEELNFTGRARNFFQCSVALASLIAASDAKDAGDEQRFLKELENNQYPPSVNELTSAFADLAQFDMLEQAASDLNKRWPKAWKQPELNELSDALQDFVRQAGLASGLSPLTSVSGYFETKEGRKRLWNYLFQIFKNKKTPTPAHRLIGAAAENYLATKGHAHNYLIVTANYDCLMEQALDDRSIPYVVLTLRKNDGRVYARFCDAMKEYEEDNPARYAKNFVLGCPGTLVILYKMHGCLYQGLKEKDDSVIISDEDYVDYITRMASADGVVPAVVNSLMNRKHFLFLGYSLNDWNVRSILQKLREKREMDFDEDSAPDYSVMYRFTEFERKYCDKHRINIVHTNLNSFVDGLMKYRPKTQAAPAGGGNGN